MLNYTSKKLHHDIPSWVQDNAIYHIRVRAHPDYEQSLIQSGKPILDSVSHYARLQKWSCYLFVLLPDHAHALLSFGIHPGMKSTVKNWKRYHATQHKVRWQEGFFDHRIRNQREYTRVYHYTRNNPVALGLCANPDEWPWQITACSPEAVPHF